MGRVGLGLKGMSIVLDTVYTGNYALTMPGETYIVIACRCTRTRKYPSVGRARVTLMPGLYAQTISLKSPFNRVRIQGRCKLRPPPSVSATSYRPIPSGSLYVATGCGGGMHEALVVRCEKAIRDSPE